MDKTIAVKPLMDMWVQCPNCGHDPDYLDCGGFRFDADKEQMIWIGPSFCPNCCQAFDLSELNETLGC